MNWRNFLRVLCVLAISRLDVALSADASPAAVTAFLAEQRATVVAQGRAAASAILQAGLDRINGCLEPGTDVACRPWQPSFRTAVGGDGVDAGRLPVHGE